MGLGVSSSVVESAANLIGCSILQMPFNFLGVKVGCNMSRIGAWDDVISKVSSRLSKWKLQTLSIGGRLTLLKSVLTSIPLYHMSIFKVPMGVLKKLESIRRNFFNGHDGISRKSSWFSWNKALASKRNGGLGISSFFATNSALLVKWVWRFFSDGSSLWSSFIKSMFGNHGATGLKVQPKRRSTWYDILQAVNSLKDKGIDFFQFIRKKIGNGVNTSFWDDSWIDNIPLKVKFQRLYALEDCKCISVAEKLGHSSLHLSFRRLPRGGVEQESFNLLCDYVGSVVLSNVEDRWSWSLAGSGVFSVHSSRTFIDDFLLPKSVSATRWIKLLPIKINVFAWKVSLDALPTRCNMSLRGIEIPSILCPLCNQAVENSDHIFFSCSLVRKVWIRFLIWWESDVTNFNSYNEWISWMSNSRLPKGLKGFLEGSCYVLWWLVWKFRNRILFSDASSKPDSLFDDVVHMSYLWLNSRIAREVLQLGRADIWSFGILAPELAHGHALLLKYHQIKKEKRQWMKGEHVLFQERALSFISSKIPVQGACSNDIDGQSYVKHIRGLIFLGTLHRKIKENTSGNEGWNKSESAWHADGTLHDICSNKVHSPY
ncbi:RNA-directed DNA polymerase, eukaryota, reverse transcriptase zinc-binding domain protein [Tanacetum coccineum]